MAGITWPELGQNLIKWGLHKPLFGFGLISAGVGLFENLGNAPKFIPEGTIIAAAILSPVLIIFGLVILLRWAKQLLQ